MKISFTADNLAQIGHVIGGALVVLGGDSLLRRLPAFSDVSKHFIWVMVSIAIFYAAVKEFWFDIHFETPATIGNGLVDFTFYMIGIFGAVGLFYLAKKYWAKKK